MLSTSRRATDFSEGCENSRKISLTFQLEGGQLQRGAGEAGAAGRRGRVRAAAGEAVREPRAAARHQPRLLATRARGKHQPEAR